jgi:hypothetical protein
VRVSLWSRVTVWVKSVNCCAVNVPRALFAKAEAEEVAHALAVVGTARSTRAGRRPEATHPERTLNGAGQKS